MNVTAHADLLTIHAQEETGSGNPAIYLPFAIDEAEALAGASLVALDHFGAETYAAAAHLLNERLRGWAKQARISAGILALARSNGGDIRGAFDAVIGHGAYGRLAAQVYDEMRAGK